MDHTVTHPSDLLLAEWAAFRLSDDQERLINQHLAECEDCSLRVDAFVSQDRFAIRIREILSPNEASGSSDDTLETMGTVLSAESVAGESDRMSSPPSDAFEVSRDPTRRWSPQRMLARGGLGEIWIALDRLLGGRVALKRLRPHIAGRREMQERFFREARITACLNHPGIPVVLDLHQAGPDSFYTMYLIEGRTLLSLINAIHTRSRLSLANLLPLVRHLGSVANTIAYANNLGVIHRDLKSENVVIGEFGQATLIDWGLAKVIDSSNLELPDGDDVVGGDRILSHPETHDDLGMLAGRRTVSGVKLGTPAFMAPEQARGDNDAIDQRTDVYGLAAMLYELLVGEPPFTGRNIKHMLAQVQENDPKPPIEVNADVPRGLNDLCLKGLSKDPEQRPPSASEFARQLELWLQNEVERRSGETARIELFSLTKDLMALHSFDARMVWGNQSWQRQLGWSPETMVGWTPEQVMHPDDVAKVSQALEPVKRNRESVSDLHVRMRTADGRYRWFDWTSSPVPGEDLICSVGRDIDSDVRSEDRQRQLLDAAPDAMVVIDTERKILFFNTQAEALFGYSKQEVLGKPVEALIPERLRENHASHVAQYALSPNCQPLHARPPLRARRKDGSEVEVQISLSPIPTKSGTLYAAALRPVDADGAAIGIEQIGNQSPA
ncbi:MAG: PAS domain S-box protein [Planctomycetota bacterium]